MVRVVDHDEHVVHDENAIALSVTSFMAVHTFHFVATPTDTLLQLRQELAPLLDAHPAELVLRVGPEFPYPLVDNLRIAQLLPHHRALHVMVCENPSVCIPRRLLEGSELRLERMVEDDLEFLDQFIVRYDFAHPNSVHLDVCHPLFVQACRAIVKALDTSLEIETRPQYPKKFYFFVGSTIGDDNNNEALTVRLVVALLPWLNFLNEWDFRHVRFFVVGPGLFGVDLDTTIEVTPELVQRFSTPLARLLAEGRR